jgi:lysozyme
MATFKKATGWTLACACFVGGFEGLATTAYPDRLAHNLPTVCYGETEGVRLGDHYTPDQCADMLALKLPRYWREIERCIHVPTSDNEKIAFTSAAYNFGSGAFCKGAIARRLNAGNHVGACNALLAYDHASGVQVRGLTRRRQAERTLCLTPDKEAAPVTIDLSHEKPIVKPAPKPVLPKVHWWTQLWHALKG